MFLTTVGDGAATVELAYLIGGDRRRRESLKLPGFASDFANRSCLVAKGLTMSSQGQSEALTERRRSRKQFTWTYNGLTTVCAPRSAALLEGVEHAGICGGWRGGPRTVLRSEHRSRSASLRCAYADLNLIAQFRMNNRGPCTAGPRYDFDAFLTRPNETKLNLSQSPIHG